jgi:hypothetical protein
LLKEISLNNAVKKTVGKTMTMGVRSFTMFAYDVFCVFLSPSDDLCKCGFLKEGVIENPLLVVAFFSRCGARVRRIRNENK